MCACPKESVFTKIFYDERDTNLFLFEKKILLLLMRDTATKRIISLVIWSLLFLLLLLSTNNQNCSKPQRCVSLRFGLFLHLKSLKVWSGIEFAVRKPSCLKILKAECLKWELQEGDAKIPIMGGYIVWNVYPGSSQEMRRKFFFQFLILVKLSPSTFSSICRINSSCKLSSCEIMWINGICSTFQD